MTRKTRRLRAYGAAAIVAAVALTACSTPAAPPDPSAGAERPTVRIAYSVDQLDAGQSLVLQNIQARVDEINASDSGPKIEMDVYDAQASVQRQLNDVQNALIKQPDVLMISVVDSAGSAPAIAEAKNQGVKVINTRPTDLENLDPNVDVAFMGSNEHAYAAAVVEWMQKWLDANPDKTLNTGIIYGAAAQVPQLIRGTVIEEFAAENPDRVKILATSYTDWLLNSAQDLTQDWLLAHPDMNFIIAANDSMALGAYNALVETGRTIDDVAIAGYNADPDAVQRVKNGTQTLTVGMIQKEWGQVIDIAVGLADGTFTERTYLVSQTASVTKDTVDQFIAENPQQSGE